MLAIDPAIDQKVAKKCKYSRTLIVGLNIFYSKVSIKTIIL